MVCSLAAEMHIIQDEAGSKHCGQLQQATLVVKGKGRRYAWGGDMCLYIAGRQNKIDVWLCR